MRYLVVVLFLASVVLAQPDDVVLTATHDKLNDTVRQALAADAKTLKQWAERVAKEETANKEFCPDYERRALAGFYRALGESKTETGEKARAASAQAAWSVYQLAAARPATKEDLKQLLLKAKEGAPAGSDDDKATVWDFPTQARIERTVAVLEKPLPGRIRISQQTSECFLAKKIQPPYPYGAIQGRIQGDAVMKVAVGRDGKVIEITPVSGQQILLDDTVATVKDWRWRPYYIIGQTAEFETTVTVKFTLGGR